MQTSVMMRGAGNRIAATRPVATVGSKPRFAAILRAQVDNKPGAGTQDAPAQTQQAVGDNQPAPPAQIADLQKLTGWTPPQQVAGNSIRNRDPDLAQDAVPGSPDIQPSGSAQQYGVSQYPILGPVQEAINGRSAMLGFVAAVAVELSTHQGVVSQLFGKYVNEELVEKPIGTASLFFFAIVILNTAATLMPKLLEGEEPGTRTFGPFTPFLETILGRTAMLGFLGLLGVELIKGSSLF